MAGAERSIVLLTGLLLVCLYANFLLSGASLVEQLQQNDVTRCWFQSGEFVFSDGRINRYRCVEGSSRLQTRLVRSLGERSVRGMATTRVTSLLVHRRSRHE